MGLLNKFRVEGRKKDLYKEIADNLWALFNTKQSFGAWQKGFGMRSYAGGKSRADIIDDIVADMKYNIENFEKRIKVTEILILENNNLFQLRFQINCLIGSRFHSYYVGFKQPQDAIQVEVEK